MTGSSSLVQNCQFINNSGPGGGAIWAWDTGSPTIESSTFIGNTATESYGGACGVATSVNATITSSIFKQNSSIQPGGAIGASSGIFSLQDSVFCDNVPDDATAYTDLGGNSFSMNCAGHCCTGNDLVCVSVTQPEHCLDFGGVFLDLNSSCDDCPAPCAGDTDGNGVVNIEDLLNMMGSWGACP